MNGIADNRDVYAFLLGDEKCSSFINGKIDFDYFFRRNRFGFKSVEALLQQLTWILAQVSIGEIGADIFIALASGTQLRTLSQLSFTQSAGLCYCPKCRECDVARFGVSYWHRVHQLPMIFFCPEHGERLVQAATNKRELHYVLPSPSAVDFGRFKADALPGLNASFWQRVAEMTRVLLDRESLSPPKIVRAVLMEELQRRKLAVLRRDGHGWRTLPDRLTSEFMHHATDEQTAEAQLCVRKVVRGVTEPAKGYVLGSVALFYWLFGEWPAVEEKCRWMEVLSSVPHGYAGETFDMRQQNREACIAYMDAHGEGERLEFCRTNYRAFRWLLHHDKVWLDRQLPIPHRCGQQLALF